MTHWEQLEDKTGRRVCDFCDGYGYYNPTGYSQEGCPKCDLKGYVNDDGTMVKESKSKGRRAPK